MTKKSQIKARFVILVALLLSPSISAEEMRVYCKPDGIAFEKKSDGIPFTKENKIFNVETVILDENNVPPFRYREQLRCQGGQLIVDPTIKTPYILKKEEIQKLEDQLDTELTKPKPDVVMAMRLKRAVELKKKGRDVPFSLNGRGNGT